tara:strand:- start:13957 stop:15165 length:1209 start_codon:yes stop_codon:yes gene_type:complete
MKNLQRLFYLLFVGTVMVSCSSDDDGIGTDPDPSDFSKTYQLGSVEDPDISGIVIFTKNSDNSITADINLDGTPSDGVHPAHVHFNTAAESGDIAITLGTVDGATGLSSTTFTSLDDGTPISYEELIQFDGYVNVHLSSTVLDVIVAQGDIGQNELTGDSKVFDLGERDVAGISGTATFEERVNGEALATLQLENTPDGGMHPAHIHMNTAAEGGDIAFTFNPVDGTTGMSKTNVAELDDNSSFNYASVLEVDGYINVHLSADDLATIVAQGDIGQNELTGEIVTYDLMTVDVPGIDGIATFEERVNGTTLVTIALVGTVAGDEHPAHIHENDAQTGGDIIIGLNPVDGETGMSMTQVGTLDAGTAITYSEMLTIDGYINVHLSADELTTIVAQGDVGANAL